MHLQILPPFSSSLTPLAGVPPLGALLVLVPITDPTLDKVLDLLRVAREYPWCPIVMPPIADPARFEPFGIPASRVVLVDLNDGPEKWRTAVQSRPLPTYQDWSTSLAMRADPMKVARMRAVFERSSEGSAHRRKLRQAGLPSPADCRDIFIGCVCLADALRTGDTIAVVAKRHGLTGTRLAAIAKRCFGMGWHQLRALGAWEPGLEQALRYRKVVVEPSLPPSLPPSLHSAGRRRVTRPSDRRVPGFWPNVAQNRLSTGLRPSGSLGGASW